ncbi:MAG: glycosyltransferase [Candidatus Heimdallarchaeota archaeon]|nr:glycosyltransferase [Candidatus Heimdallarchaeota archaeon]MCK4876504.1 glycosyltransferase [Candidatus Heimdallarchaeota archaeon]
MEKIYTDLTVIIPTLNEEESIPIILQKIDECVPKTKVIIADDGSTDKTKELVESFEGSIDVLFLDRKKKIIHGLTISVLDAIKNCKTPMFLVMDGDLQHPPDKIVNFYAVLKKENDLVGGRRIKVLGKWPLHRRLMSIIASLAGKTSLFIRRKNRVKDVLSGFFASKTELWQKLLEEKEDEFTLEGYKVLFDFLKIYPSKLKISHVDYVFGIRGYGESKINSKVIWLYFKSLFKKA